MVVVTRNTEVEGGKVLSHIEQKMLKKYQKLEADLAQLHKTLLASLKLGATVEFGPLTAFLDEGEEKRADYRAELLLRCGEEALKDARAKAEPKPYCRLRVREKAETKAKKCKERLS
jgi:hypothetical protein